MPSAQALAAALSELLHAPAAREQLAAGARAAADAFARSDPYHLNGVWDRVQIHRYNKKRGTSIVSKR